MKTFTIFLALTIGISYLSCKKNSNAINNQFEAKVLGRNSDCGLFAIKFTDNLDKVMEIAGASTIQDVYIAENLPIGLQTADLIILVNIRKPLDSELGECTALGPSYPWIYIISAKLK